MVKKEWIDKGFVDEPVAKELDLKSEIRELCRKKNAVTSKPSASSAPRLSSK